jgi:CMP/dCMP kinase
MESTPFSIAIDGFAGCGKSTTARRVASHLGFLFIDTGAMYRAFALFIQRNNIAETDEASIEQATHTVIIDFANNPETGLEEVRLNDERVEAFIRTDAVSLLASRISQLGFVRRWLVRQQQAIAAGRSVVMEGRDIGTVVLPTAQLKVFMTARPEVRAERRLKELLPTHPDLTLAGVMRDMLQRDEQDTTRAESPLRQADDARVLDTSDISPEAQVAQVCQWAREGMSA